MHTRQEQRHTHMTCNLQTHSILPISVLLGLMTLHE